MKLKSWGWQYCSFATTLFSCRNRRNFRSPHCTVFRILGELTMTTCKCLQANLRVAVPRRYWGWLRWSGGENAAGANGCKQIWGGRCPIGIEVGGGGAVGKTAQVQMAASKFRDGGASLALRLTAVEWQRKWRWCKWLQANLKRDSRFWTSEGFCRFGLWNNTRGIGTLLWIDVRK